uniref:Sodium/potassium-transporting ATPase subunit beta-1-interacting protein n=1 Tax=Megaselia scalaris TaxID=36166 RepID=T1GN97_MEGSC
RSLKCLKFKQLQKEFDWYIIWCLIWIGWNSFLICFYLNIGVLNNESSDILNFGTGSYSWFVAYGPGCQPADSNNNTNGDPSSLYRPEVEHCILDYEIVEIIHSVKHVNNKSKHRQSLYSIEFGPSIDSLRSCRSDTILDYDDNILDDRQLSPKPMTPRRVKRRSVMTRGTNNRQSTTSRRSQSNTNTNRNSTRSSRRKYYNQNPVTKLMEQQIQIQQKSQKKLASFRNTNNTTTLTTSNLLSFNSDMANLPPPPPLLEKKSSTYNSFPQNIAPDPIYYNMGHMTIPSASGGHYNPTYQHSTSNLANNGSS